MLKVLSAEALKPCIFAGCCALQSLFNECLHAPHRLSASTYKWTKAQWDKQVGDYKQNKDEANEAC